MSSLPNQHLLRCFLSLAMLASCAATAQALTIDAVADTWLRESAPTTAYSDDPLSVWDGTTTDQRRQGVVVFDLSSTAGVTIDSAFLELFDMDDGGDGRSEISPLVQQAYLLNPTPGTFVTDLGNVEAYTWEEYITFDEAIQQPLDSLGNYNIPAGDIINGYQPSDLASSADISLLEQVRDSSSDLVVFILEATSGERDWGDIEYSGTAPRLVINEGLPPALGDIDGNGSIGTEDFDIMVDPLNWLQTVQAGTRGDITGNGVVDLDDFSVFKPIYLYANPQGSLSLSSVSVPEPTGLALLTLLGVGLTCTSRRHNRRHRRSSSMRHIFSSGTCRLGALLIAAFAVLLVPRLASAVTVSESYDAWIRDEGLTLGDRDGDWLGVYNNAAGSGLSRWAVLEYDFAGLDPVSVTDLQMGFWRMYAGSPVASSDNSPSSQTVAMITEVNATTPTPSLTWGQLNDPGQVTLTPFDSLGAVDLQGLAADPAEADRYHYGAASPADIALVQPIIDAGGTLRVVVRSDESVSSPLKVDWGDGPDDGDSSHGQSSVLLINELPPEFVELTLQVDTSSGEISIVNPGADARVDTMFDVNGYVISSQAGSLNASGFAGLAGAGQTGWGAVAPTSNALSDLNLTNSTVFAEGDSLSLGAGFTPSAMEDLTFSYSLEGEGTVLGKVEYVGLSADFDNDGDVDQDDLNSAPLGWQSRYGDGLDGRNFLAWQRQASSSVSVEATSSAVPEPSALLLLCGSLSGIAIMRRRS